MFQKGKSGNPKGRKVGSPNKVTGDLRARINTLLSDTFDKIIDDFDQLEPRERVAAWAKLAEYVLPKHKDYNIEVSAPPLARYVLDDGTVIEL